MNFIDWGLAWFEEARAESLVEDVEVTLPGFTGVILPATVTSSSTNTDNNRVKLQAHYFHFIFVTASLVATKIPINRGLIIRRTSEPLKVYELAWEGKAMFYYNDPNKLAIVLQCVERVAC